MPLRRCIVRAKAELAAEVKCHFVYRDGKSYNSFGIAYVVLLSIIFFGGGKEVLEIKADL